MKIKKSRIIVTTTLPIPMYRRLTEVADANLCTKSHLVRQILLAAVNKYNEQPQQKMVAESTKRWNSKTKN